MPNVELAVHKGCPICIMTEKELKKKQEISLTVYADGDPKGTFIIQESGLTSAPVLKVDGKFYAGNDALKFAKSLK